MWTLWGMGITAVGTTVMLILAYVAQSPRLINRLGLSSLRLDLRARTLTGYALALLLLSFGFFLAGVPLGPLSNENIAETAEAVTDANEATAMVASLEPVTTAAAETTTDVGTPASGTARPASGAFGGPPPAALTATAEALDRTSDQSEELTPESRTEDIIQPSATITPTATITPSPTPSPTPTVTPTPTFTPTPIFEDTAIINTGSSTLWLKRTPGGQDYYLVKGGDAVILFPGHANIAGSLWREVSTVDGTVGWVLESYLDYGEEDGNEAEVG
ncbi:MAG: hypothetical protein GWP61_09005 [Chloroflexi bacterium]|nr:hypothetical protein [Chloroflexota bacterium]